VFEALTKKLKAKRETISKPAAETQPGSGFSFLS